MWNAQGAGDLQLLNLARHGHRSTITALSVGGFGPSVRSTVTRGRAANAVCQDRSSSGLDASSTVAHDGRVEIELGALASLGTRCAGPLIGDIASVLPRRTVSLARLRRGKLTIDLDGSARFAAGGFSGTVESTVTLTFGGPRPEPPPKTVPNRLAEARYEITRLGGTASATVRVSGPPAACAPLDACGSRGTFTLAPHRAANDSVVITAAGRHRRSKRDLLAALGVRTGGHPAGIDIYALGTLGSVFTGRAVITQAGGSCSDTMPHEQMEITMRKEGGRLRVQASPFGSLGDPLRSRCPGPRLNLRTFSSASLPLRLLRQRQLTIRLHGHSFQDGPYDVTTHSSLIVTMHRTSITTRPTSD